MTDKIDISIIKKTSFLDTLNNLSNRGENYCKDLSGRVNNNREIIDPLLEQTTFIQQGTIERPQQKYVETVVGACIYVSFYDPQNKDLVAAHFYPSEMNGFYTYDGVEKMIALSNPSSQLEVRVIGGMSAMSNQTVTDISTAIQKKIINTGRGKFVEEDTLGKNIRGIVQDRDTGYVYNLPTDIKHHQVLKITDIPDKPKPYKVVTDEDK